jgi:hypothetical protein
MHCDISDWLFIHESSFCQYIAASRQMIGSTDQVAVWFEVDSDDAIC